MKKLVLVFALMIMTISGAALAQDPNWFDNVGVYFDEAGDMNCGNVDANVSTPMYLVFTRITSPDVLGWEIKFEAVNGFVTNVNLRGDAIDAASRPGEHVVGLAAPMPVVGGTFVAADMELLILTTQVGAPTHIVADGTFFHLLANKVPAYLTGSGDAKELHPVNNSNVIAYINDPSTPCSPVAEETNSWGSLKSLFR